MATANAPIDWQNYVMNQLEGMKTKTTTGTSNSSGSFTLPKSEEVRPYSGLPESYRDQLLSFVMPQLQTATQGIYGNIDQYTQGALSSYEQSLNQALKQMLPKIMGNLANRGVLSSSVASDTMSQAVSQAALESANKGYQTQMEAAVMKTNLPAMLGNLLQLGQSSEDPTVLYRTMASLLASI